MKHLLPKLMLMITPMVMMAKTAINPPPSASFNIKAIDQQFSANPSALDPNGPCQALVKLSADIEGVTNCASNKHIYYKIDIDLDGDGTIDMIASSEVNHDFSTWTLDTIDQKMKCFIAPNSEGNFTYYLPQFSLQNSIKVHKVFWHIYDECGQESKATSTFQVKDKKAPTPYCVNISTALFQTNPPTVELWAKDLDKGAFDNCSPQDRLYFTFEGVGPILDRVNEPHFYKKGASGSVNATATEYAIGKAYRWHPFLRSSAVVFTACGDYNLNVSVWDEAGNTDYCTVALKFLGGCGPTLINVNGKVQSINKKPIQEAKITFYANLPEYPKSVQTKKGLFSTHHPIGVRYEVSAEYNEKDLYNVNQKDVLRLERHLSGQQPFKYYWQFLAANIHFDNKIDERDLELLKKLILTKESDWFVIQKVDTLNTLNWYKTNDYVEIINQTQDVKIDFTAILIGDIDGSSAGLDVVQYDSNYKIKSDNNDITRRGNDVSNGSVSSFEIITQNQLFAAHPSPIDPKCTASVRLEAEIKGVSNCVSNNLIYYHVDIDLDSDGTIDMIASSKVNQNFVTWTLDTLDQKMKCFMVPNAKGNFSFEVPQFIQLNSIKTHKVSWSIYDECGISSKATSTFQAKDTKAPTPYCVSISTALLPNDGLELFAKDYDKGAFDNCSSQSNLTFTFHQLYPVKEHLHEEHYYKKGIDGSIIATHDEFLIGEAYRWIPAMKSCGKIVKCKDFLENNLNVSVWDEAGNTDYCTPRFRDFEGCDQWINIDGKVNSINNKPINEATVTFDANLSEYPKSVSTQNGLYSKKHIKGYDYAVSGTYPKNDLYNVNQKDINRLEKHLSGQKPFTSYWQFIAADVNFDKKVDEKDLEFLKKIIPIKESIWLLIQKVDLLNSLNWYNYNHYVELNNLQTDVKIDFTAILIGDIDGSSAGLDVVQYDSNYKLEDNDETTWRSTLPSTNDTNIKVYPNPYSDQFNLEIISHKDEVVKIALMDISGKVGQIKELHCYQGKNSFTIDDPFLESSGIQMIRLESISGVQHIKVVKTSTHP